MRLKQRAVPAKFRQLPLRIEEIKEFALSASADKFDLETVEPTRDLES